MKTPILLHIPEPCHENWDAMTNADKGRHCQSCNKIVVDFSVMSDRQVLEYFKTTTGKTCGRFHDDQLQRPLIEPHQKSTKWNYLIASILGFIMTGRLAAQDRTIKGKVVGKPAVHRNAITGEPVAIKRDTNNVKTVGDTILLKKQQDEVVVQIPYGQVKKTAFTGSVTRISSTDLVSIAKQSVSSALEGKLGGVIISNKILGKITDEKGAAIGGATIILKGTGLGVSSDINGDFEIKKLGENNKLTLVVSSIGFERKEIDITPKDLKGNLNIVLKEKKNELEEVVLVNSYGTHCTRMGGMISISSTKTKPSIKDSTIKIIQKIFNRESIKIFPNPATKNDIIHITIKDAGEYALHFFDTQSRLLTVKNIVTNTNNQTTEFPLPSTVLSGNYFIRILNEKTKKQVTEKIIVQ